MAKKKAKKRRRKRKSPETALASPDSGRKKINGLEFYVVDNALDTMTRAEEIQKDERLMKATEKLLKTRQDALDQVERSLRSKT